MEKIGLVLRHKFKSSEIGNSHIDPISEDAADIADIFLSFEMMQVTEI